MTEALATPVTSLQDAKLQIQRYQTALAESETLRNRVSMTRSWYALRGENGWQFAPSKFLRRQFRDAKDYLAVEGHPDAKPDGNQTELRLAEWFETVAADSSLGVELAAELEGVLKRFGKTRRAIDRISVLKEELDGPSNRIDKALLSDLGGRIVSDPRICGGRPVIRGTRMRVSDILDLLASGVSTTDIIKDFDYICEADIHASIHYAARAIDHRIIRAA